LIAIADLQADQGHPLDASRLQSVRQAMGGGVPLPAIVLQRWQAISFVTVRLLPPP
jgi:hypothetical protein